MNRPLQSCHNDLASGGENRSGSTAILGISALYHDAAAALIVDGQIVAAAQEERFSRKKHDPSFPHQAIAYCLSEANLSPAELSYVGFYEKPLLKFERLLETYLSYAPVGFHSFLKAMPQWLRQKLHLRREIRAGLDGKFTKRVIFCQHHQSHAASAFFSSPFQQAAILTLDGVGEWTTTSFGYGKDNKIQLQSEVRFPHSLGLLYSAFTYFAGFRVNSGEYKLMGLAPYGQPKYKQTILQDIIDVKFDGSFRLNMQYFNYCNGLRMTSRKFHRLFGAGPRKPESPIRQLDMDIAASIQAVIEEILLKIADHVYKQTQQRNLCLAGGVALNCVANSRLLREGPFESIWIQPAAGDAGGALGVAQLIWHQLLDKPRQADPHDSLRGSLLGPTVAVPATQKELDQLGAVYKIFSDRHLLVDHVAELLANQKVVGWVQDRMEYGPRALGSRSILGDPRNAKMQAIMNEKIKFRESFRPFAPSVLQEKASELFDLGAGLESPYMLMVANVSGSLPAVTHVDSSARVQTVDPVRFPVYHELLQAFERLTGCPVIINTSFNVRGEPMVCTATDAYRCFQATGIDALVVDRFVMLKGEQPNQVTDTDRRHLRQFELD